MSGGGKKKFGGMSNKVVEEFSEEQIQTCQHQVNHLNELLQKAKEEKPVIERARQEIQKKLSQAQTAYNKTVIDTRNYQET